MPAPAGTAPISDASAAALNALAALAALSGASGEAAAAVLAADGGSAVRAVVACCSPAWPEGVQEGAADAACALACDAEAGRPALLAAGVLPAAASLLGSANPEVLVRGLMTLGMLVGGGDEACASELAACPGALGRVLGLMRSDDADLSVISRDLYASIARHEALRPAVEAALREAAAGAAS